MSEKYVIESADEDLIEQGYYTRKIHNKHIDSFGQESAQKMLCSVQEMYVKLVRQVNDPVCSNNTLLVGQVQSGKTANLELLTAIAFDNGFRLMVIYGGYDNSLLDQTTKRFKKTFDCPEKNSYDDDAPAVFTTAEDDDLNIDEETFEELISIKPVIFVSMKRPDAMKKINAFLQSVNANQYKSFIIDDEGDQASLNTAKDKRNDGSATYQEIRIMKNVLGDPLYVSVTATPQANVYLPDYSALKPGSIHLIWPGKGYSGSQEFHLTDSDHVVEIDDFDDDNDMGALPTSLKMAIGYFVVACAIKTKISGKGKKCYGDMIIHTVREVSSHRGIYTSVFNHLQKYKDAIKNDSEDLNMYYDEIEQIYNDYLGESFKKMYSFESLKGQITEILSKVAIVLKNSKGKETQGGLELKKYKIYIGGDLLQRGLTFDDLITTYFTRWTRNGGNMDTTLQRARWFGYRKEYTPLCKIFTTKEIEKEFSNLAEIDSNIWDQFSDVENGLLDIEKIVIPADGTRLSPTNKTKASFRRLSFKMKWQKQKCILLDSDDVVNHNQTIDSFIDGLSWSDTSVGASEGKVTAKHAKTTALKVKELLTNLVSMATVNENLDARLLNAVEKAEAHIFLMQFDGQVASRSLYPGENRIKALQEGRRDNADEFSYKGDSNVIMDSDDHVNLQIYKIRPCRKDPNNGAIVEDMGGLTQYVLALYVPVEKSVFVMRNN